MKQESTLYGVADTVHRKSEMKCDPVTSNRKQSKDRFMCLKDCTLTLTSSISGRSLKSRSFTLTGGLAKRCCNGAMGE